MYISKETNSETEERLNKVLKSAKFKVFELPYYFREISIKHFQFDSVSFQFSKSRVTS